jgi:hypothetical protein
VKSLSSSKIFGPMEARAYPYWGATRTLAVVCLSLMHILTHGCGAFCLPLPPRRGRPDFPTLPVVGTDGLISLAYCGYQCSDI